MSVPSCLPGGSIELTKRWMGLRLLTINCPSEICFLPILRNSMCTNSDFMPPPVKRPKNYHSTICVRDKQRQLKRTRRRMHRPGCVRSVEISADSKNFSHMKVRGVRPATSENSVRRRRELLSRCRYVGGEH